MALEASNNNLVASLKATEGVLVALNAKFLKLKCNKYMKPKGDDMHKDKKDKHKSYLPSWVREKPDDPTDTKQHQGKTWFWCDKCSK
eukprot:scaffold123248_cov80-Attheya_sp.AAC.1